MYIKRKSKPVQLLPSTVVKEKLISYTKYLFSVYWKENCWLAISFVLHKNLKKTDNLSWSSI